MLPPVAAHCTTVILSVHPTAINTKIDLPVLILWYLLNNLGEPVMPDPRMRPMIVRRRVA